MPPGIDQIEKGSNLFANNAAATAAAIFALIAIWLLVLFIRSQDRRAHDQKDHAKTIELLNERHDKEITRLYNDRVQAAMELSPMLARGEEVLKATAAFLAKLAPPVPPPAPAPVRRSGPKRALVTAAPSAQTEVINTGNSNTGKGEGDE